MTYFLYPRAQMWRAFIEAGVLDEMLLALCAHTTTVIPVEVVQVRVILVSPCAGVGIAACIVTPWFTLKRKWTGVRNVPYNKR